MKIRYQLRGLGVGLIVAALVLGFGGRFASGTMSDNEIMARARQLGMVEGAQPVAGQTVVSAVGTSDGAVQTENDTTDADANATGNTFTGQVTEKEPQDTRPMEEREVTYSDDPVLITIPENTDYKTASHLLAEKGLVKDETAFAKYMAASGYSMKIVSGTYEFLPGTEESDIAKIITGN